MPNNTKLNIPENIMSWIKKGQVKMKPKWYFVLGSLAMIGGFLGLTIVSIFLVSLITFSLRTHGPMGAIRYEQLLSSFPWWAPIIAIVGLGFGIWMLKKYDFSYKKNFLLIIIGFISAVLLAGLLINYLGIDNVWMKRGPMREFYRQYDGEGMKRGAGWRMMQDDDYNNKDLPLIRRQ